MLLGRALGAAAVWKARGRALSPVPSPATTHASTPAGWRRNGTVSTPDDPARTAAWRWSASVHMRGTAHASAKRQHPTCDVESPVRLESETEPATRARLKPGVRTPGSICRTIQSACELSVSSVRLGSVPRVLRSPNETGDVFSTATGAHAPTAAITHGNFSVST
jgi:hypothetical protein